MGMAASQARLLSITSRLADNELRAQIANNAKMRLASDSSRISSDYVTALNNATMMITNYDLQGNSQFNKLNFNRLTEYSSFNTQYGLSNTYGQILVSENEAKIFEAADGDLDKYLMGHGLEYGTTYFNKGTFGLNGETETVIIQDDGGNEVANYSIEDLEKMYLGGKTSDGISHEGYAKGYDNYAAFSSAMVYFGKLYGEAYSNDAIMNAVDNKIKEFMASENYKGYGDTQYFVNDLIDAQKYIPGLNSDFYNYFVENYLVEDSYGNVAIGDKKYKFYAYGYNNEGYQFGDLYTKTDNTEYSPETDNINTYVNGDGSRPVASYSIPIVSGGENTNPVSVFLTKDNNGNYTLTLDMADIDGNATVKTKNGSDTNYKNKLRPNSVDNTYGYDKTDFVDTTNSTDIGCVYKKIGSKEYLVYNLDKMRESYGSNNSQVVLNLCAKVVPYAYFKGETCMFAWDEKSKTLAIKRKSENSTAQQEFWKYDYTDIYKIGDNGELIHKTVIGTEAEIIQNLRNEFFGYKTVVGTGSDATTEISPGEIRYNISLLGSGDTNYIAQAANAGDKDAQTLYTLYKDIKNNFGVDLQFAKSTNFSNVTAYIQSLNNPSDVTDDQKKTMQAIYDCAILDMMFDVYGEPSLRWVDKEHPEQDADVKVQWYTNLFERMKKGYAVLENGLASSNEWIEYALESGLVSVEQVDKQNNWNGTLYSNVATITEVTDDVAVARAEAEYKRAMNEVENKDKRLDIELKNIDTEHSALQTEYNSIKEVITKNIDRSFKMYS